jgi:hypothetical protein
MFVELVSSSMWLQVMFVSSQAQKLHISEVIPPNSSPPDPPPSTSLAVSTAVLNSSGLKELSDLIGHEVGQEVTLGEGTSTPTPTRHGSITPTAGNPNNTTTALDSAAQSLKGLWGRMVGSSRLHDGVGSDLEEESEEVRPSRRGTRRRVEPYSGEEIGAAGGNRGDVSMEENCSNHAQHQQQLGEVRFTSALVFFGAYLPQEPTRDGE